MSLLKTPANPAITEYYKRDTDQHSTLEAAPLDHSTLEPVPYRSDEDGVEAKQVVHSSYDVEGGSNSQKSGFWKRRVCGMSMVLVAVIVAITIIGAVGGGVGGALASKNHDKDTATADPTPSSISTTTTDGNGQVIATTVTVISDSTSTASTFSKATPLPPYPTKALPANAWLKIGNSRVQGATVDTPYQLEGRWAQANDLGSIGLTPNSTEGDQVWQIMAVPQANERSKLVYDNVEEAGGTPTSLYYIACQRFGQDVRMVVDDADVERYKDSGEGTIGITMKRQDDEEIGQYWWLNQTAEANGIKTFKVHNLKSGSKWRLRASVNEEGNGVAGLVTSAGEETDLWDVNRVGKIGSQEGWFIYD